MTSKDQQKLGYGKTLKKVSKNKMMNKMRNFLKKTDIRRNVYKIISNNW